MGKGILRNCPYDNCTSTFSRPSRLTLHILSHENQRPFICLYEGCKKSYTSNSHLCRHINTVHKKFEEEYLYICQRCSKRFSNRQNLKRHIKICNNNKSSYTCDNCKIQFKKKNLLSAHMFTHTGIKSFSCNLCGKTFISLFEKKRHMRCHKTYNCEYCTESFKLWSLYQIHKKNNHLPKEYICEYCQKSYKVKNALVHHLASHMSQTIPDTYSCTYEDCSRTYTHKRNLTKHIKMSHMKITYDCDYCSAKLTTKAKLVCHVKRHTEPEQFRQRNPNTKRKKRKDQGSFRVSTALKLAGLTRTPFAEEDISHSINNSCQAIINNVND